MNILILILIIFLVIIFNILFIIKKIGIDKAIFKNVKLNIKSSDNKINFRYDEVIFDKNIYERYLPFKEDLNYIYWLSVNYNITNYKTNIIGAYLTKWYKNNSIKIIDKNTKISRFLYYLKKKTSISLYDNNGKSVIKNKVYVQFNEMIDDKNEIENKLFNILKSASGFGLINEEEFFDWLILNSNVLCGWFDELYNGVTNFLIENEMLNYDNTNGTYVISDKILSDVNSLINYKNFLENYVDFKNEKLKDVHLYDSYIVNSVLLGVNSNIKKDLGEIYPKFLFDIKDILNKINTIDFYK